MTDPARQELKVLEYRPSRVVILIALGIAAFAGVSGIISAHPAAGSKTGLVVAISVLVVCFGCRALHLNQTLSVPAQDSGEPAAVSRRDRYIFPLAGFAAVVTALCLLEQACPYYFTQDDNIAVNLPSILEGAEACSLERFRPGTLINIWDPQTCRWGTMR